LNGFARVGAFYTLPFRDEQLVGGNGGFRMADFRFGVDVRPRDWVSVVASIEIAAPLVDANDPLTGRRIVDLRDAYVQLDIHALLRVRVGQMRAPFYAEMLQPDGEVSFTTRSILASGLNPPDGYGPRSALAFDRQVGVQLFSQRLVFGDFGLKYALGVFNGNGQNQLFNDNNSVQPVARVEVDFRQQVTLGLNGSFNPRSEGVRPNRLLMNQLGLGADVSVHVGDVAAMAAVLLRSTTFSYAGLEPESAFGTLAQLHYEHPDTGLEAALRVALYEPSTAQRDDVVVEATAMVGWRPFKQPFRVVLQFTHRDEETLVAYANESLDLMLHAAW
jgi:hypothetical protein